MRTPLLLLALAASTSFAADDFRTFNEKDMADLAGRLAKDLRKCKELKHGTEVHPTFQNKTSDFIDKEAFSKAIVSQLPPPEGSGPGKSYDLLVQLSSTSQEKGSHYTGTYVLKAEVKQANEALCSKTEKLVKEGTVEK